MVTLEGQLCSIVSWRKGFEEELFTQASSEKIPLFLLDRFPKPYLREHAQFWINNSLDGPNVYKNLCIAVKDAEGHLHVAGGGALEISEESNTTHVVRLGYWLGEEYWGKGIMSEAVGLFVQHGFSEEFVQKANAGKAVLRIEAMIFEMNVASGKVLSKNGFLMEGRHRMAYQKEGKFIDGLMYAKINETLYQKE